MSKELVLEVESSRGVAIMRVYGSQALYEQEVNARMIGSGDVPKMSPKPMFADSFELGGVEGRWAFVGRFVELEPVECVTEIRVKESE